MQNDYISNWEGCVFKHPVLGLTIYNPAEFSRQYIAMKNGKDDLNLSDEVDNAIRSDKLDKVKNVLFEQPAYEVNSVELFSDLVSGANIDCLNKVFSHSCLIENDKNVDSFVEINNKLSFSDEKNVDRFRGMSGNFQSELHYINGLHSLLYQVSNGGVEQYFDNKYHEHHDIKGYIGEYCLPELNDNIDSFYDFMCDNKFFKSADKLKEILSELNCLEYVEDFNRLSKETQINIASEIIEDWETEQIIGVVHPGLVYVDKQNFLDFYAGDGQDILDRLDIPDGGYIDYQELENVYGTYANMPEFFICIFEDMCSDLSPYDVACQLWNKGEISEYFDIQDVLKITGTCFVDRDFADTVSSYEIDKLERVLWGIEPAITHCIDAKAQDLLVEYTKTFEQPLRDCIKESIQPNKHKIFRSKSRVPEK